MWQNGNAVLPVATCSGADPDFKFCEGGGGGGG